MEEDHHVVVQNTVEEAACTAIASNLETIVLSHDDENKASSNQSSFFRAVEEGNIQLLQILLRPTNKFDVNVYNDQGMTASHLAVYKYETRRKLDILDLLLNSGANACLKAAAPPQASKLSIVRHDVRDVLIETRRISLDQKTPLLLALELKSALYLRGWEYRHWDPVLKLLAAATLRHLSEKGVGEQSPLPNIPDFVKHGWTKVFESGDHTLIEVNAEGKGLMALKLLLSSASKKLKLNLESMAMCHSKNLELKDISFSIAKAMVKFIYTGSVDPDFMEHRGIDLLHAAHKYGVDWLKSLCEVQIKPTQDNWIKLLTAANECDSDLLVLKCARSIEDVMVKRQESHHILQKSFSELGHGGPNQLFQ